MCRLRISASCGGGGIPGPYEHETQPRITQVTTDELLVHHGGNGLPVAPRDPAALAAAISEVLADLAAASGMSAASRRTAAAYAWPDRCWRYTGK